MPQESILMEEGPSDKNKTKRISLIDTIANQPIQKLDHLTHYICGRESVQLSRKGVINTSSAAQETIKEITNSGNIYKYHTINPGCMQHQL